MNWEGLQALLRHISLPAPSSPGAALWAEVSAESVPLSAVERAFHLALIARLEPREPDGCVFLKIPIYQLGCWAGAVQLPDIGAPGWLSELWLLRARAIGQWPGQ